MRKECKSEVFARQQRQESNVENVFSHKKRGTKRSQEQCAKEVGAQKDVCVINDRTDAQKIFLRESPMFLQTIMSNSTNLRKIT